MQTTEIRSKVVGIIAEMFQVKPEEVKGDKPFKQMANYNSMRALEFLAKLETEFNITLDPDLLPKMTSVDTSIQVVEGVLRG